MEPLTVDEALYLWGYTGNWDTQTSMVLMTWEKANMESLTPKLVRIAEGAQVTTIEVITPNGRANGYSFKCGTAHQITPAQFCNSREEISLKRLLQLGKHLPPLKKPRGMRRPEKKAVTDTTPLSLIF